jgi:hypothetical protein
MKHITIFHITVTCTLTYVLFIFHGHFFSRNNDNRIIDNLYGILMIILDDIKQVKWYDHLIYLMYKYRSFSYNSNTIKFVLSLHWNPLTSLKTNDHSFLIFA